MTTREKLHRLVDELPESELEGTLDLIASRSEDPVVAAFRDAPEDDEPLTADEERALADADADIAAGRTVPLEEIERRYGVA
jgi:predicted transcriptional regulator